VAAAASGLKWQRTSDVIGAFVSRYGSAAPRRAVFCTYDFDVVRFEAVVFPKLTRRGRQFRTLVTADAGALQAHFRYIGARCFGRFQVSPVRCLIGGVFHPKLILLAAGRHYLVGVGSANLTSGGLGGNLEMMLFADNDTERGQRLLGGAAHFMDRLIRHKHIVLPESARDFIGVTLAGVRRDPGGLSDSLYAALVDQMSATLPSQVRRANTRNLTILSPWHSGGASPDGLDPAVLRTLKRSFAASDVALYTEGRNGRGPDLGSQTRVHIRTEQRRMGKPSRKGKRDTSAMDEDVDFEQRPTRVHAKAYIIQDSAGSGQLFFGSANCTQPALTRAVTNGGNVELLVSSKIGATEMAAFRGDLADLFTPAVKTFVATAAPAPAQAAGMILAGQIVETAGGTCLKIEAPALRRGTVEVAATSGGKSIQVRANHGVGWIKDRGQIHSLFGDATPSRSSDTWGGILWEKLGKAYMPFPVVVPLIASDQGSPDGAFLDMVWEELGLWPRRGNDEEVFLTDDEGVDSLSELECEDMRILAEATHEGQLDRLAVAVAVLRRRIISADVGRDYAKVRLKLLQQQIEKLEIPSHIRSTLVDYLNSHRRVARVK